MSTTEADQMTAAYWMDRLQGHFPGLIGIQVTEVTKGLMRGRIAPLQLHHMAPNGYMHAATAIGLADTLSGFGCIVALPEGATGFTTVETKSNHLGTAREGAIACIARLVHGGRTTQVWDAEVTDESNGKIIALFRCTQMVLYPKG